MLIKFLVNDVEHEVNIELDDLLIDVLRKLGYTGVKRGCDTTNCGLCTVMLDEKPILSCSYLAIRASNKNIKTIEGLEEEAKKIGDFMAQNGADQCGYCNPGFLVNVIAMKKELVNPSDDEIKNYLAGNLCRCSGYVSQLRAIRKYLEV